MGTRGQNGIIFYTTYTSVDLSHHVIFHYKFGNGGIIVDIEDLTRVLMYYLIYIEDLTFGFLYYKIYIKHECSIYTDIEDLSCEACRASSILFLFSHKFAKCKYTGA